MTSTGLQPQLQVPLPPPPVVTASPAHRWLDLALVMSVAFSYPVLTSLNLVFHPVAPKSSNMRLVTGVFEEATALLLFMVLWRRQGRSLKDIGLSFRWTDIFKSLGLAFAALVAMFFSFVAIKSTWVALTSHEPYWADTQDRFATTSVWLLLPFLLLNPFFEEILVRGYLMTEIKDLRKSVVLAMLISIGLQTSYHLYYGVAGALVVGSGFIIFAAYYAKSRRLMPVILAHLLWDLTALLRAWHR